MRSTHTIIYLEDDTVITTKRERRDHTHDLAIRLTGPGGPSDTPTNVTIIAPGDQLDALIDQLAALRSPQEGPGVGDPAPPTPDLPAAEAVPA